MKILILSILSVLFFACAYRPTPSAISPFIIQIHQLQLSERIRSVVFSQGHYYCLLENGKFICLNREFQIDSSITKAIGQRDFDFAFLENNQLRAAQRIRDTVFEEYTLDQHFQWQKISRTLSKGPKPSIKEPFSIDHCCIGEFGGAIFFKDNATGCVYSCPATCVAAINEIENQYYITSFAPNGPSSEILLIKDPRELYELKVDSLKNSCNWWTQFVSHKDGFAGMKKFETGTEKLLDTIGLLTVASFERKGELYHLCSDQNRSFLGKLVNGKMQMVDSIFTENLWPYETVMGAGDTRRSSSGAPTRSGFFAIQGDTIAIVSIQYRPGY